MFIRSTYCSNDGEKKTIKPLDCLIILINSVLLIINPYNNGPSCTEKTNIWDDRFLQRAKRFTHPASQISWPETKLKWVSPNKGLGPVFRGGGRRGYTHFLFWFQGFDWLGSAGSLPRWGSEKGEREQRPASLAEPDWAVPWVAKCGPTPGA